jgi:hypothetical protein
MTVERADRAEMILTAVRAIPEGFVRTYGDIAPGAPRLVGQDSLVPWAGSADARTPAVERHLHPPRRPPRPSEAAFPE